MVEGSIFHRFFMILKMKEKNIAIKYDNKELVLAKSALLKQPKSARKNPLKY